MKNKGTTNDISLSLDSINVRDSHNFYGGVSKPRLSVVCCLSQYNLDETSNCVVFKYFFFPNYALRNRGCCLSKDAAYIHERLGYLLFITSVNKHAISMWPPSISLGMFAILVRYVALIMFFKEHMT